MTNLTPQLPRLLIRMHRDDDGTPSWTVFVVNTDTPWGPGIRIIRPIAVRDTLPEAHTAARELCI